MAAPGRRRSTAELARDRRKVADLYLKGWIQADIATEIGMSQKTVSNDIKALQKDWLNSALVDFNEAKSQELAKIDRLEREYWQAWERSCEDAETITEKARASKGSDRPDSVEKTKQAKGQAGDPRFLSGVQWCIERRCKMFGLDEPDRFVVDWRQEAREAGLDPSDVFERYIRAAETALAARTETT